VGAEDILRLEDKVLGLPPYKELVEFPFSGFSNDCTFGEFCTIYYFEFLILFSSKILKLTLFF
jgi:hypothetical protein